MAIGWMTVLKLVPWGDVIENAPKVAAGARKLMAGLGKKPHADLGAPVHPVTTVPPGLTPQQAIAALQAQVQALELATADLQQQMQESAALVASLAEQNTQLVQRVEINRQRVLWLALLGVLLGAVVAVQYFR